MKKQLILIVALIFSTIAVAQSSDYEQKKKAIASVSAECERNEKIVNLTGKPNPFDEAKRLAVRGPFIDKNFKIKVPMSMYSLLSGTEISDPAKCSCTLEQMDFGDDGKTILLTFDFDESEKSKHLLTVSWSGKNLHLGVSNESGLEYFGLLRNSKQLGLLARTEGKWLGALLEKEGAIHELYKGMTRADVEAVTKQLGLSQFKFSHKTALYQVYSLYWLDMEKQYNIFGNYKYNMRNDKKWGDFYFNSNGKLIKWILYM